MVGLMIVRSAGIGAIERPAGLRWWSCAYARSEKSASDCAAGEYWAPDDDGNGLVGASDCIFFNSPSSDGSLDAEIGGRSCFAPYGTAVKPPKVWSARGARNAVGPAWNIEVAMAVVAFLYEVVVTGRGVNVSKWLAGHWEDS